MRELVTLGKLVVLDARIVTWDLELTRPVSRPCPDVAVIPRLRDEFWGMLLTHLFLLPLARQATGASMRDNDCSLSDLGICDTFVRTVRGRVHAGTSALFLLTPDATVDRVIDLLEDLDFTATSTNLTTSQESSLHAVFAGEPSR